MKESGIFRCFHYRKKEETRVENAYLYVCVFGAQKKNPLLIASEAVLLTWLESLAVMTKTLVRPVFVQQSWKSGFHIGTICAVTSDPAQRQRIERACRFVIQKSIPGLGTSTNKKNKKHVGTSRQRTHADQLLLFHSSTLRAKNYTCKHFAVRRGQGRLGWGSWEYLQHIHTQTGDLTL